MHDRRAEACIHFGKDGHGSRSSATQRRFLRVTEGQSIQARHASAESRGLHQPWRGHFTKNSVSCSISCSQRCTARPGRDPYSYDANIPSYQIGIYSELVKLLRIMIRDRICQTPEFQPSCRAIRVSVGGTQNWEIDLAACALPGFGLLRLPADGCHARAIPPSRHAP